MQDPRLKMALKGAIELHLYAEPERRLRVEFEEIFESNSQILHREHWLFYYKGKRYKWNESVGLHWHSPPLDQLLHVRMEKYLAAIKELDDEKPLVLGYIQNVLNTSDDPDVYLNLLPTALHEPLRRLGVVPSGRLSMTEAEKLVKTHSKSVDLLKQRLMFNMLFK